MTRYLPLGLFLLVAVTGLAGAAFVWTADMRAERIRFAAQVDDTVNRIEARLARHLVLIDAAVAFFEAEADGATPESFQTFAATTKLARTHPDLEWLGFAAVAEDPEEVFALDQALRAFHGIGLGEPPAGAEGRVTLLFVEPGAAPAGLPEPGTELLVEPGWRRAMEEASRARLARASLIDTIPPGPLSGAAATDTDRPEAILRAEQARTAPDGLRVLIAAPHFGRTVAIPSRDGGTRLPTGFVLAGLDARSAIRASLELPPFVPAHVIVRSGSEPDAAVLYESPVPASRAYSDSFRMTRTLDVAGLDWTLEFRPTDAFAESFTHYVSLILGTVSLLLAAALAVSQQAQARARETAERLADTQSRNLAEKELMLQEMKHRIKNSITRINAIARQTARHAKDLESFETSFSQRLQAMANAQDILTRSRWQMADLDALVRQELEQVFGDDRPANAMDGPPVKLNETAAQALGLAFHELATNAVKYGAARSDQPGAHLCVTWALTGDEAARRLVIDWREAGLVGITQPAADGFGTRLIDAMVRVELSGTVERTYASDGLTVTLSIPAEHALAAAGDRAPPRRRGPLSRMRRRRQAAASGSTRAHSAAE